MTYLDRWSVNQPSYLSSPRRTERAQEGVLNDSCGGENLAQGTEKCIGVISRMGNGSKRTYEKLGAIERKDGREMILLGARGTDKLMEGKDRKRGE